MDVLCLFFFFKQKTAYEMRISDWSSDVCSSDLCVIPSAIEAQALDQAHLHAFTQTFDLSGRRVLATAAALTSEKDPCTLVRAVHRLRQKRDDFVFLHLGAGGDAEAPARALVQELGLQGHYLFAGFQAGIEDLYRLKIGR